MHKLPRTVFSFSSVMSATTYYFIDVYITCAGKPKLFTNKQQKFASYFTYVNLTSTAISK